MSSEPLISVVMSVYNGEKYLEQSIQSILDQTFTDFEFIICNDASTDSTSQIIDRFHDSRIKRLANKTNLGLTRSLNIGIKSSKGIYIARHDADDESMPDRFRKQLIFLESNPRIGLVGSGAYYVHVNSGEKLEWIPCQDSIEIQKLLMYSVPFRHGTFMFRRECLKDFGDGYDEKYPVAQDCDLLFRIAERWELANLPDILYLHRIHSETISASHESDQEKYLYLARRSAAQRRISYGWYKIGFRKNEQHSWIHEAGRLWLGKRFLWWAESSRSLSKLWAFEMYFFSLMFSPFDREFWDSIFGILRRKLRMK